MDKRRNLIEQLKNFKSELSKEVPIKRMILFGSRAKGKAKSYSDVDLIIVSPKFKGTKFRKRPIKLYKHWKIDLPKDLLCYTPEEFNKKRKESFVVSEAVKEGIEI